jgi:HD-like signal output (HDOD) protein
VGELEDLVLKTVEIPSVPKTLLRLQEVAASVKSSVGDAVKVVEEDAGLAARCLKIANSAMYGLRFPCSTLEHAASVVGLRKLKDLAVQTSLVAQYTHLKKQYGFNLERFWQHGAVTSIASREIARKSRGFRGVDAETAAACGLLHNIGRLAMIDSFRASYLSVILPSGGHGKRAVIAEHEAFGFDHATVGGLLAVKWKLAPEIIEATRDHHTAPPGPPSIAALVGFATDLAHTMLDLGDRQGFALFRSPEARIFQLQQGDDLDVISKVKDGTTVAVAACVP